MIDTIKLTRQLSSLSYDGNIDKKHTQLSSQNHHSDFASILISNDITLIDDIDKKSLKLVYGSIEKKDGFYFIEEPNGSQNSPDFRLYYIYDKKIIKTLNVEMKTGNKKIMWNDGYPKEDCLYIYTDNKQLQTLVFSGSNKSILHDSTRKTITKYLKIVKNLNHDIKKELKNNRDKFTIYIRKANSQKIDISKLSNIDIVNITKHSNTCLNMFFTSTKTFEAISLFSGAGGDTLGMKNANINVSGFVEFDKDAIQTHLYNFPESLLIGEDITKIENEKFRKWKGIDFIFGGFPCQSFSHGGKKNPDDERGILYKEFVRITDYIKPKIILGENVQGILTRRDKNGDLILDHIIKDFNDIGYTLFYKLIRCEDFGIAQKRSRVFIIGVNRTFINVDTIQIPTTNHTTACIRSICTFNLVNAIKVEKECFIQLIPTDKCIQNLNDTSLPVGKPPTNLVKCYNEEKNHGLSFDSRKKSTFSGIEDIDKPTHTILCTYNRMPRLFVPLKNKRGVFLRPFTICELQQIQGFPVDFVFKGLDNSVIKQIGNAVPPIVVTEIMNYLKTLF